MSKRRAKNPLAVALGKLAAGHPKTMSVAAIEQRQTASKKGVEARRLKRVALEKAANLSV